MKSKTSFFNAAILRSDVTRFAPVWILYTVGFLLMQLVTLGRCHTDYQVAVDMRDMLAGMVAVNGLYGILVALVLFGDMLNPRLCSSIHAMPLTRDDFFATHAFAGFCFSIIPNALVMLVSLPMLGKAMPMAMYLFAVAVGTYVLYFGTALLAVQLAGNRIAAVLIYGIIHFISVLLIWFARYFYEPLLYGIRIPIRDTVWKLCPTVSLMEKAYVYLICNDPAVYPYEIELIGIRRVGGWGTLAVWTVVGMAAMAAAQILYRRRKLEVAGDLLAHKRLEPIFQLIYTMTVAGFFHVVSVVILEGYAGLVFALVGIAVGWFTGKMLLMRQVNVFRWKNVAAVACLMAVMVVSALACALDVGGLVHKTLSPEAIEHVEIDANGYTAKLRDAGDIDAALRLQKNALAEYDTSGLRGKMSNSVREEARYSEVYQELTLRFFRENGKQMKRTYYIPVKSEDSKFIDTCFSRPETVFGVDANTPEALDKEIMELTLWGSMRGEMNLINEDRLSLLEAMLADCAEGTMNQLWAFHRGENLVIDMRLLMNELEEREETDLRDFYTEQGPSHVVRYVYIRPSNTHAVAWLLEHEYVTQMEVDDAIQRWQEFLEYNPDY